MKMPISMLRPPTELLAAVVLAGAVTVLVVPPVVAAGLEALEPSAAVAGAAALEPADDGVLGVDSLCTGNRWWCPWWRP